MRDMRQKIAMLCIAAVSLNVVVACTPTCSQQTKSATQESGKPSGPLDAIETKLREQKQKALDSLTRSQMASVATTLKLYCLEHSPNVTLEAANHYVKENGTGEKAEILSIEAKGNGDCAGRFRLFKSDGTTAESEFPLPKAASPKSSATEPEDSADSSTSFAYMDPDPNIRAEKLCAGVSLPDPQDPSTKELVSKGRELYESQACIACHSLDGSRMTGISAKGLYKARESAPEGATQAICRSTLASRPAPGKSKMMPLYIGQLSKDQLRAIVAFIRSVN